MICSHQITREHALEILREAPYPVDEQLRDREYVIKKLGITDAEFDAIMQSPKKSFHDYPSYERIRQSRAFGWLRGLHRFLTRSRRAADATI